MGRVLLDGLGLFAAPFLVYGLVLVLRQRYPFVAESWSRGSLAWLTLTGLVLVVAGLLLFGSFAGRYRGAYVPAHIEDGRLVPGHIE
jgi:hypothetical protein